MDHKILWLLERVLLSMEKICKQPNVSSQSYPLESAVRRLVVHFVLGYPSIIEVRAQGSGVLNHTTCFHSYLNSKLSLKLIGREKTKIENFTSEAHSADVINLFPNQAYFQLSIDIYVPL